MAPTHIIPIEIIEVGPRDGLQNEKLIVPTHQKVALVQAAFEYGIRRIEVASFVNPRRVPQMADGEDVVAGIKKPEDACLIGLVLNQRGARRALATNIDELGAVAVASERFGIVNQGQTPQQSINVAREIIDMAKAAGKSAQVTISVAFGCPFEGRVDPQKVADMAGLLAKSGPKEIALADTIGVATPFMVEDLVKRTKAQIGDIPLRLHFHNTRGTGLANVMAGIGQGVRRFDSSLGGIGGCPFAPNATGNIATEDLAYMLSDRFSGGQFSTGLDLEKLLAAADLLADIMGKPLPALLSRAGLPKNW